MSELLLPKHPGPHSDESLLGYFLRLSELNGYVSPRHLRQLANMDAGVSLDTPGALEALARISNQKFDCALGDHDKPAARSILESPREAGFLRTQEWTLEARICPECIETKGYIEAHWAIPHMFACPVHRSLALSTCPRCRLPLRWYRPGLLECSCGATLKSERSQYATDREVSLLDLIRRKTLGELPATENPHGFPTDDLMAMTLGRLVDMVDALARTQEATIGRNKRQVVFLAAQMLSNWPHNFFEYLDPADGIDRAEQFRKTLLRVHHALCGPQNAPRSHMDFIGALMVEYALRRYGYRHSQIARYENRLTTGLLDHVVDPKRRAAVISNLGSLNAGTRTASEAAQFLGCSSTAIQGLVRSGKLSGTVNAATWRINRLSLERFRREHVFLREIAESERTSVRTLKTVCRRYHIQVLIPRAMKKSGIQPYIRTAEIERLKSGLSSRRASKAKR